MNRKTTTRVLCMVLCLVMLFLAGCTASSTAEPAKTDGETTYQDTITLFGVSSKLPSAAGMLCFILSREAFSLPSSLPAHMPSFCHGIYQSPLIAQTAAL